MLRAFAALAFALVVAACGNAAEVPAGAPQSVSRPPIPSGELVQLAVEPVATGLDAPVAAAVAAGDSRIFVVEKRGTIRIIDDRGLRNEPYADLSYLIEDEGLEQGLVGLAFHPEFAANRRVFVSFTNRSGDGRVMEYRQSPTDPDQLDRNSGRLVLAIEQPHEYHNGGTLRFGPDGKLWIGVGDGGGVGDPWHNGQNPHSLLGALLRIDVDSDRPYAIPGDNPFADGRDGAPEVWAYGLRNPWTFSFSGDEHVIVAEVGHELWDEIDVAPIAAGGGNFGWPIVEGLECFAAPTCDDSGLLDPALLIAHRRACAVVGGPVYRGRAIPELMDHLLYADFCVGWVREAELAGDTLVPGTQLSRQFGEVGQITALAEDPDGEVLILTFAGDVYRIIAERTS